MGTTQKGIISRTIGTLFSAGCMGKNGGFHIVKGMDYYHSSNHRHYCGSSKVNNRQPRKPQYSLVATGCNGIAQFRNRSTGKIEFLPYKTL